MRRPSVKLTLFIMGLQAFVFVESARYAFTLHDPTWAVIAALMLGAFGVNIRGLIHTHQHQKDKQP